MGGNQDINQTPIVREDRMKTLSGYLTKVARVLKGVSAPDKPVRFDTRTGSLEFSASEVAAVRQALLKPDAGSLDLASLLLAETLALRLKVSEDTKDFETAAGLDDELEEVIAGCLRHDLALADSLVADYRLIIDQMFVADDREGANRLGEFRMAVRQDMSRIRQLLLGEDVPAGDGVAAATIFGGLAEAAEHLDLDGILTGAGTAQETVRLPADPMAASQRRLDELREKKRHDERKRRQNKRLRVMFLVLGVVVFFGLVELVVSIAPALQAPESVILTMSDFAHITVVIRVEATPPSLLVTVNGNRWRKMNGQERTEIVRKVGLIVDRVGYNGVQLRNENGKLAGEWIRGIGTFVPPP